MNATLVLASIKSLIGASLHGGTLKGIALIARLAFFLLAIPMLGAGELAIYVYISSTAVLLAMVLVFGLDEDLPRAVAGSLDTALTLQRVFILLSIATIFLTGLLILSPSVSLGIVTFTFVIASGRYLGGIIRGLDSALYERLINIPWVLFIVATIALGLDEGIELILAMSISMVTVQWYCLFSTRSVENISRGKPLSDAWKIILKGIPVGFPHLLSNLLIFATIRSPLLWPVWFSIETDLDQIALAITVGEVVLQFGMIPVFRAHTQWCKSPPMTKADVTTARVQSALLAGLLACLSCAGLFVLSALNLIPPQLKDLHMVLLALVYYSLIPAFYLIRYLLWSRAICSTWIVFVSFLQFCASGLIVMLASPEYWFPALGVAMVLTLLLLTATSRRYFSNIDSPITHS